MSDLNPSRSRRIVVSCDSRGLDVARHIVERLVSADHEARLLADAAPPAGGDREGESGCAFDYPDEAWRVACAVTQGEADLGVLVSGSAIGMCIAANKCPGVRAVIAHDEWTVRRSRAHHNCNVLCVPADLVGLTYVKSILNDWLNTEFEGGRHERRVNKIAMIERGEDPSRYTDRRTLGDSA